jgi:ElaB/YqjD/DUF883 family membrane-anchored ribosome-binding protein
MEESMTKAEAQELRGKMHDLDIGFRDLARVAKEKIVTSTKEWTKEHPLAALGIAVGLGASVGFAIGLLVGRNRG